MLDPNPLPGCITAKILEKLEHFGEATFRTPGPNTRPPGTSSLPPQSLAKVGESGGSQKTFGSIDVDPFHQGGGRGKKIPKLFASFFSGASLDWCFLGGGDEWLGRAGGFKMEGQMVFLWLGGWDPGSRWNLGGGTLPKKMIQFD